MINGILTEERIYNNILQNKTRGSEFAPGFSFGYIIF
tara:strand:+ start:527 stop:637 length:111 start_codon:yes stop_codon:yes gene_type:complete